LFLGQSRSKALLDEATSRYRSSENPSAAYYDCFSEALEEIQSKASNLILSSPIEGTLTGPSNLSNLAATFTATPAVKAKWDTDPPFVRAMTMLNELATAAQVSSTRAGATPGTVPATQPQAPVQPAATQLPGTNGMVPVPRHLTPYGGHHYASAWQAYTEATQSQRVATADLSSAMAVSPAQPLPTVQPVAPPPVAQAYVPPTVAQPLTQPLAPAPAPSSVNGKRSRIMPGETAWKVYAQILDDDKAGPHTQNTLAVMGHAPSVGYIPPPQEQHVAMYSTPPPPTQRQRVN